MNSASPRVADAVCGSACAVCSSRRGFLKIGGIVGASLMLHTLPGVGASHAAASGMALNGRPETAAGRFGGMSCAQALATTYADLVGLEEQRAKGLAAGFGLGMGKKQTCGAVTVMLMLAGLAGKGDICEALTDSFEKEMGSTQCAYFVDQFGYGRCKDLLRYASSQLNARVFS